MRYITCIYNIYIRHKIHEIYNRCKIYKISFKIYDFSYSYSSYISFNCLYYLIDQMYTHVYPSRSLWLNNTEDAWEKLGFEPKVECSGKFWTVVLDCRPWDSSTPASQQSYSWLVDASRQIPISWTTTVQQVVTKTGALQEGWMKHFLSDLPGPERIRGCQEIYNMCKLYIRYLIRYMTMGAKGLIHEVLQIRSAEASRSLGNLRQSDVLLQLLVAWDKKGNSTDKHSCFSCQDILR